MSAEHPTNDLSPSTGLAWIIGALACGGYVGLGKYNHISVDSIDQEFLEAFQSVGERLFLLNAKQRFNQDNKGRLRLKRVTFISKDVTTQLGDLRRPQWSNTVRYKHTWILDNPKFGWAFLQGVFDRVGNVSDLQKSNDYRANLHISDLNCAYFLAELLVKLGIEQPRRDIQRQLKGRERFTGIVISRFGDIQRVSLNIRSVIAEKERRLEMYRQGDVKGRKPSFLISRGITLNDLITEWKKLKDLLGHTPNSLEIQILKKEGRTPYSLRLYTRAFGDSTRNFNFGSTRETLVKILFEQDISAALKVYEQERNIQVRFVQKIHRSPEDEAKKRLEEWLSEISKIPAPNGIILDSQGNILI